jgi:uncharacterized protein DUF6542
MSEQAQRHIPVIRLTGRGAVLGMLAVFALGLLGASWLGWGGLAGASFVAGSAVAVFYVRPRDLLMVTIAPPLLFCVALVGVKAGTATGNMALATVEGAAVTLAGVAPWLFAGTALSLVIAWSRGLRERVRELGEELRPGRTPGSPAGPGPGPSTPGAAPQSPSRATSPRPAPAASAPPDVPAASAPPDAPASAR